MATITQKISSLFCHSLIKFINLYQYLLSPWLGNQCRFLPTCSCYAKIALQEHGTSQGLYLIGKRLSRCHPWHEGGYDPVIPKVKIKL